VENELIKEELGVMLEFPTYKEGLYAISSGELGQFELGGCKVVSWT